jgi:Family of unknown function (DUF5678)
MATAAVSIAPVLTPQTLGVLADSLERAQLPEKASSLRRLQPFVQGVVEKCFVPLLVPSKKGRFVSRFNRLAKNFEPLRLYLNIRLLSTLENQDFFGLYQQTIRDLLEPLMKAAYEMDMGPELLSAVVRDYMKILEALAQPSDPPSEQGNELTVEQFTALFEWFRAATRLDYGLTAVFLVLERSIPKPAPKDKASLLSACKNALLEFGRATSRVIVHEHIQRALQDLETPHITIAAVNGGLRVVPLTQLDKRPPKAAVGSSRHSEINWLVRNKELSDRYGGQWIVLEKDELVANDADYSKAREVATRRGIKRPFIIFIPLKESGGFMGI